MLDGCLRLRVLATSREVLSIAGELTWRVPSLSLPEPQRPPAVGELHAYGSSRLFVERARRRRPGFTLTPENVWAVAKALTPAEIIVLDTSEAVLDLAKGLGADHTVKVDGNEVATVRELTGGLGAEAVVDFVGEDASLASGIPTLRQGGTYYLVGYGGTLQVSTAAIIAAEISFVGNLIGSYRDLLELMDLTAQGEVTLHISAYPLGAINDAVADLNEGKLRGWAILVPEDAA